MMESAPVWAVKTVERVRVDIWLSVVSKVTPFQVCGNELLQRVS